MELDPKDLEDMGLDLSEPESEPSVFWSALTLFGIVTFLVWVVLA